MARLTPAQRDYLRTRIAKLYGFEAYDPAIKAALKPEPPEVTKARALVKKFDDANSAIYARIRARYREQFDKHRSAILFMEPATALAYVEKLKPIKTRKVA